MISEKVSNIEARLLIRACGGLGHMNIIVVAKGFESKRLEQVEYSTAPLLKNVASISISLEVRNPVFLNSSFEVSPLCKRYRRAKPTFSTASEPTLTQLQPASEDKASSSTTANSAVEDKAASLETEHCKTFSRSVTQVQSFDGRSQRRQQHRQKPVMRSLRPLRLLLTCMLCCE